MTDRKNLTNIIIVVFLSLGVILGIYLVKQTQVFKPKAGGGQIEFFGDNIKDLPGGKGFTLDSKGEAKVNLRLTSPLGPATPATGSGGI